MKANILLAVFFIPILLWAADYQLVFKPIKSRITRMQKKNGTLILTPGPQNASGGVFAEISNKGSGPLLLEADVKCTPVCAYLQIVMFKNKNILLRATSERNRKNKERLQFYFDPSGADKVQLLMRAEFDGMGKNKRAVFSNIRLVSVDKYVADKAHEVSVSPGFNVCSVYIKNLKSSRKSEFSGNIEIRKAGESAFTPAPPPVFDYVRREARSCILKLESGCGYELNISFSDKGKKSVKKIKFRTQEEKIPVAKTVFVTAEKPLVITASGKPDGYIRYTAKPGTVLDFGKDCDNAITISNAKYILLDNMKVKGGKRNAVHIWNCENTAVINCDISDFGEKGSQQIIRKDKLNGKYFSNGKMLNNDSGIYIEYSKNIRIERCFIHDPAGTSNSWFYCHPAGPDAVFVRDTKALSLRYNDFIGSDMHRWNDAVISAHNFIESGGSFCEAEFSGNTFAFGNDDSVELDGGQINACFSGNYITNFLCGVSPAPCIVGPSYIFDNLFEDGGEEYGAISAAVKNNSSIIGRGQVNIFSNIIKGNWKFGINPFGGKPYEKDILTRENITSCLLRNNIYQLADDGVNVNPAAYRVKIDDKTTAVPGISNVKISSVHPVRPLNACVDRKRICFKVLENQSTDSQKIILSAQKGFSGKFKIITTANAPFSATSDSNKLEYNKPVTVTVSAMPEKIELPRVSKSIFLIRFENGLSLPIYVSIDATDRPAQLAQLRKDAIPGKISSKGNITTLVFNVKKSGVYHLFCRIDEKSAVTVKVAKGNEPARESSFFIPAGKITPWSNLGGRIWRGEVTYPHKLSPGKHVFTISGKADIKSAVLTENPDAYRFAPEK